MQWDEQQLGRHLKLRDLNVLLAVARYGSMGKAAAQLSVSQPAISKAVADMEHTLGVRLLDRGPQGVEPTIYGRALLDRSLIAFDELRQAVKHIEFLADPTVGEVRIATPVIMASGFVAKVIDRLSRRFPRVVVHTTAGETGMSYRALEERKVDLVIARIFGPIAQEKMRAEPLYDEHEIVVAGPQSPWARRRVVRLADLMNETWTLPPLDTPIGAIYAEAFRASGLDLPHAAVITSSAPARIGLVASGRFLTIVPASILRFAAMRRELNALPIDLPTARRPVGVIALRNRTVSPVAQLFIDCAREVAKPLVKSQ